jgi:hypothetical protein
MLILSVIVMCYTDVTSTYIKVFICHFEQLMIAHVYSSIKNSSTVLCNCKCCDNYSYGNVTVCWTFIYTGLSE